MRMPVVIVATLLHAVGAVAVIGQDVPSLQSVTYRFTTQELILDYEYAASVQAYLGDASLTYQGYASDGQPIGRPEPLKPQAGAPANQLRFVVPLVGLTAATDVAVRAQITTGGGAAQTPLTRIPVDLASKLREKQEQLEKIQQHATEVSKENEGQRALLSGPICNVAPSVKFEGVVATFPEKVWLHFTTPSAGRIHVRVPRTDGTVFDFDSAGTQHYVPVDRLEPATTYQAEAWVLLANDGEKPMSRINKINHDPRMQFRTADRNSPPRVLGLEATPKDDTITVAYEIDQEAGTEVTLEQVVRDSNGIDRLRPAGGTVQRIATDRFGRPTVVKPSNERQSVTFGNLTAGGTYVVTVRAINKYGQEESAKKGNLTASTPAPALDFADAVDLGVTPAGYVVSWNATAEPDPEFTNPGPLDDAMAGLRVSFPGRQFAPVTIRAGRDKRKLTAMLDKEHLQAVVAASLQYKEAPLLTAYMKKGSTTASRSFRVSFALPSPAAIDQLALTKEQKDDIKTAVQGLAQRRSVNIDWKRLATEGLKVLVDVAF